MKALIVTGGRVYQEYSETMIKQEAYDLKIAADSGMKFYYAAGILPDLIVGDFDSADPEILSYFEKKNVEICRLNPIKDDTDTEHAIRSAIERGADEIAVFGCTGTRLDHVLGNLTLLGIGPETGTNLAFYDPWNRIRMISSRYTIKKREQYGRFVSLIPFAGEVTGVTLTGMKYPLADYTMGGFNSLGISNEITGEEAVIDLKTGHLIVVESDDNEKQF